MELPKQLIRELSEQEKSKISRMNYKRRQLQKAVDKYVEDKVGINSSAVAKIGDRYGFKLGV